ncbi:MAG: hypothetical protein ABFD18_20720 [Syntrophomonas sp.]
MNNSLKRFVSYLLYVAAFGYLVIKSDDYHRYLKLVYSTTFNTTSLWLFMSIFPIVVGLLIALPQFITTLKQKGPWKVDWIRLLTIGLPALCISITPIFVRIQFALIAKAIFFIVALHPSLVTVAGILFGFVFVTSFDKQESERTA